MISLEKKQKTYDDGSSRSDYPPDQRDDHYSNKNGHKQRSVENDPKHIDHWKKKAMCETLTGILRRGIKLKDTIIDMAGAVVWAWQFGDFQYHEEHGTPEPTNQSLQFEQTAFAEFIEKEL